MAYGNKYKEKHSAVRFKKSYFIMQNKMAPLMFWVFKWGGMNLQVSTSISCHPVEILTHWLGRQVIQLLLKNLKNKWTWEVTPTQCPWHTDTLIILLYFMTVSMHMIINVTTSDLCFLVFSATTTLPGYYYYNDDGSNYYVYHWEWWTLNFDLVRLEL